jgi:hypothetical protein
MSVIVIYHFCTRISVSLTDVSSQTGISNIQKLRKIQIFLPFFSVVQILVNFSMTSSI